MSSVEVTSFKREHLQYLHEQRATASTGLVPGQLDMLEADPWTITLKQDDEVLLCGGVVTHWPGRGEAWAVLSEHRKRSIVAIHRAAIRLLDFAQNTLERIEAIVCLDHEEAQRWVQHLGFRLESPRLEKYHPDGRDCAMYVRMRS